MERSCEPGRGGSTKQKGTRRKARRYSHLSAAMGSTLSARRNGSAVEGPRLS